MKGDANEALDCLQIQRATQLSLVGQVGGEESKVLEVEREEEDNGSQETKQQKHDKKEHKQLKARLFEDEFPPAAREIFCLNPKIGQKVRSDAGETKGKFKEIWNND